MVKELALFAGELRSHFCGLACGQFFEQRAQHFVGVQTASRRRFARRAADHDNDFAARGIRFPVGPCAKFFEGTVAEFLVQLGDLARDAGGTRGAERHRGVGEHFLQAVRRLVEDQRARVGCERGEPLAARFRFRGKKTFVTEAVGRQAGGGQRGDDRGGAGHRHDANAGVAHRADQRKAGIVYQRRAGVTDERAGFAGQQALQHGVDAHAFIVFVQGKARRIDAEFREQPAAVPRVFAENAIDFVKNPFGAARHVFTIADRRGDHVENSSLR